MELQVGVEPENCLMLSRSKDWLCSQEYSTADIAIEVNISIMRAFVALRKVGSVVRKDDLNEFRENIMGYIDDILADQNDINESTRAQLDAISTALAELQAKPAVSKPRRPIGFIQPHAEDDDSEGHNK